MLAWGILPQPPKQVPLDEIDSEGYGEVPERILQALGHGCIRFSIPICGERYSSSQPAPRIVDNLERLAFHPPQFFMQVADPLVGGDRDGPIDAVVGDEHSVVLEGGQDGLHIVGKA